MIQLATDIPKWFEKTMICVVQLTSFLIIADAALDEVETTESESCPGLIDLGLVVESAQLRDEIGGVQSGIDG